MIHSKNTSTKNKYLTRRHLLTTGFAIAGLSLVAGLYTSQVEPRWVEFTQQTLPIRHLPSSLASRTLVQLSDIHIGNRFDWHYMIKVLQNVAAMQPDFVVYTGDYVSYESPQQFDQLRTFLQYAPTGRLGTAAVLGNHDYGHGWREPEVANTITDLLENVGITVLRNSVQTFAELQIIGVDDFWGINYDPTFLAQQDFSQPTLVLCHNPDISDEPIWDDYTGWILAGHTHGGQVKPPFLPPPLLPVRNKNYTAGTFDVGGGRTLYINRGLGHLWPVRFNVRPEVTIFTLKGLT